MNEAVSTDGPQAPPYLPIEDYAAVGNLRTVALISRHGSVDWCCMPQLDSPSVFAALLDHRRGGRFTCGPAAGPHRGDQQYVEGTNVLETSWQVGPATLKLLDFMPLSGSIRGLAAPVTAARLFRVLQCHGGRCDVTVEWSPRHDYARADTTLAADGDVVTATAGSTRVSLAGLPERPAIRRTAHGDVATVTFTMEAGDVVPLLCFHDGDAADPADWQDALDDTVAAWREWSGYREGPDRCDFGGRWQWLLDRSALTLKLLTYPTTGAIAAAATTSLPEEIGGERNWDYRYSWIRDASFTADAFVALGHRAEAIAFLEWAELNSMRHATDNGIHLMYTLDGEPEIPEVELEHLEGYRRSRPVRVGNKASSQFQLDIYGELMEAAHELIRLGADVDDDLWSFLSGIADQACARWQDRDYGIWEVRSEPRHFVHSKVMVWVALDRALRLADRLGRDGNIEQWTKSRDAVHADVLEHGYNEKRGAFVQSYGSDALDAANLLIPVVGFLPARDPRVQGTIDRTLHELVENGLVYRYRTDDADDGLAGHEGAFGLTTFWLIDALVLSGRVDEAKKLFDGIAGRANHVGLFSEEIDPGSGIFLGNFPQAFSHIGLINSAIFIANAEGRDVPAPLPLALNR